MTPREILPTPARGFLVDMGRWHKVASIDKVLHNEVGWEWKIQFIRPLDSRGRRFLVEAAYEPSQYAPQPTVQEIRNYTVAPDGVVVPPTKKEPVMGEDIFSKTQMRRVQAELMSERETRMALEEELQKYKAAEQNSKKLAKAEKEVKMVTKPVFMKEGKATETPFKMLRNCVMSRLSELERFDCKNIRLCAEVCGANDRGIDVSKFVRSTVTSCLKLKYFERAGDRNGEPCYRMTEEGKKYVEEVRSENK